MQRRFLILILLAPIHLGLLSSAAHAQSTTITDERVWFVMPIQGHIGSATSPWRWSFETILRSRDGLNDLDTMGLRPIINYDLNKRLSIGGGYGWSPQFPVTGGTIIENRIFAQMGWLQATSAGNLTFRVRLEERYVENNSGPSTRLRLMSRFSHPIHKGGRLALLGYDELLLNLNDTTRYGQGVDQNRAFAGISQTVNKQVRFEVGYLNQFQPGHHLAVDRMNHVLNTSLTLSF
jgi:hypothetical protein